MVRSGYTALSILAVCCIATQAGSHIHDCAPCRGEECNKFRTDCPYGVVKNWCEHYVCGQGPGERCGGRHQFGLICGDGMQCNSCKVCTGCSQAMAENGIMLCDNTYCPPNY
ncbi:neuroparsin-A-like [Cimex lectularius]|uniref:Neuropeptide precursor n=1 Tax=Cimex lectularius TaxID=79782 RepID=A0A8I6S346_CIMLE|nr:neuroparsin-A-like [Cimex lectularius]